MIQEEGKKRKKEMGMSGEDASQIQSLLKEEEPFLVYSEDGSKIVCTLNNHELPVRRDVLESFVRCVCL